MSSDSSRSARFINVHLCQPKPNHQRPARGRSVTNLNPKSPRWDSGFRTHSISASRSLIVGTSTTPTLETTLIVFSRRLELRRDKG